MNNGTEIIEGGVMSGIQEGSNEVGKAPGVAQDGQTATITPVAGHTPHKCPICEGRGVVPGGFYSLYGIPTTAVSEPCRQCGGYGLIWA